MTTTPTLWLSEQRANTSDSGPGGDDQREPQVVGLADGTFVVLWEDNSDVVDGDAGTDIIGQRFDAEGNKIGGEFQANSNRVFDDEGDFTARALPNGNFVLVYEDTDADGTSIVFDIKSPTGIQVDSGIILDDPGADVLGDPSVAVAADGSFLVTYQRSVAGAVTTEVVKVDGAGNAGAPQVAISGSDSGFQTDVAALTNGNFVVVSRFGQADDALAFRIVNAAGVPQGGADFVPGTDTNGAADSAPKVTALAGGGFVVAWAQTDANDTDVRFQIFSAAGATVGGVGSAGDGGASDNNNEPDVVALPDGGFVVVFDDDEANTVALQRFGATGALVGTEVVVTGSDVETTPTVTLSDDGRLLVSWTTSAGGNQDVEVEIFDPRETVIDGDNTGETTTSRLDGATVNGNGGGDTLLGQGANDTLNGGGGDDVIRGRNGNDLIQGGLDADTVFGDGGDDTIYAMTQAAPLGSGVGDDMAGGLGADGIFGSGGGDTISGDGGKDTLVGGAGDDIFAFAAGDVASGESVSGGAGLDRLVANATVNFVSASLSSVEEIEFAANNSLSKQVALRADQVGAGIAVDALIDGNASSAADKLKILMLDDTVLDLSQFTFQDFDTAGTENDRLQVVGDGSAETYSGSSVRDDVRANGGNDTITGGGGLDVLRGGLGNDTYFVDQNGEAVEGTGQGTDTVNSTANYILYAALENLNLVGVGAINGTGNNLLNTINGNGAVNKINGKTGNDTLTGGGGADQFLFDSSLNGTTNVDTITDFQVGVDEIRLDDGAFLALSPGALPSGAFRIGAAATEADDRIIYNSATGELFYDPNGVGGAAAVRFAVLDPGLALTADDFRVF